MASAKDYRDQSVEELLAARDDLLKELFELRNEVQSSGGRAEKPHLHRDKRRDLARINTIIAEKQAVKVA